MYTINNILKINHRNKKYYKNKKSIILDYLNFKLIQKYKKSNLLQI